MDDKAMFTGNWGTKCALSQSVNHNGLYVSMYLLCISNSDCLDVELIVNIIYQFKLSPSENTKRHFSMMRKIIATVMYHTVTALIKSSLTRALVKYIQWLRKVKDQGLVFTHAPICESLFHIPSLHGTYLSHKTSKMVDNKTKNISH